MKRRKVLITTSGVGERLGKYTEYNNKSLVRVGDMAAISHIIMLYGDAHFIITLGYKGSNVKRYLEMAHPETQFTFVRVDKYKGDGSSLLTSMWEAREHLQEPFTFHACDTILRIPPPRPEYENWMLGCKVEDPSPYRSFAVKDYDIVRINEKKQSYLDDSEYCYVGVAGIWDWYDFWKECESILSADPLYQQHSDVHVLSRLMDTTAAQFTDMNDWYDIGNLEGLERARKEFNQTFDVLDKYDEDIYIVGDRVIKYFANDLICTRRSKRARKYLKEVVPDILDSGANFYTYSKVEGEVFSKTITPTRMVYFLDWINKELWSRGRPKSKFQDECFDFYINKTKSRIRKYLGNQEDPILWINGLKVPKAEVLVDSIGKIDIMFRGFVSEFHGDLVLDNIIDTRFDDFVLIDWRDSFADHLQYGDVYYDLAKFGHSLVMKHSALINGEFVVERLVGDFREDSYRLDLMRSERLTECIKPFKQWCFDNEYHWSKIRALMAIIWLNMSPLHDEKIGQFLFLYGRYNLYLALNDLYREQNFTKIAHLHQRKP